MEPLILEIGTEVSAKYKGAFCEAKIKKVNRYIKVKVAATQKSASLLPSPITISEDELTGGIIKINAEVTFKRIRDNVDETITANIQKVFDQSLYTVVFDDGDEATLKRSSLCLKSGKLFKIIIINKII